MEKAFGGLDKLLRVNRESRYFLLIDDPVEIAAQSEAKQAAVVETVSQHETTVARGGALSEVIAIKIHWRFPDSEIAGAIGKLVRGLRPKTSKPVQRKKNSRRDSPRAALDALAAMRLASYVPKTPAASPEALSSYLLGDLRGIEFKPSANRQNAGFTKAQSTK